MESEGNVREPIQFSLTVREAESLHRAIEVALKFGTEGKDILCFGDKRNARRIQARLAKFITMPGVPHVSPSGAAAGPTTESRSTIPIRPEEPQ